jgi:hypothetical protein
MTITERGYKRVRLLEKLHRMSIAKERRDGPTVSFEELKRRLREGRQ